MQIALHILIATALLFSTCLVKPQNNSDKLTVKIVGISDGDTVTALFLNDGVQRKIRLATIDAPEFNQPFGKKSKKNLSDLVYKKKAVVLSHDKDKYGRIVAELIVDDININVEQIKRGFAWHYKFHARSQDREKRLVYSQAEKLAREKRLGLWQIDNPTPPWDFRKSQKNKNRNYKKELKVPVKMPRRNNL